MSISDHDLTLVAGGVQEFHSVGRFIRIRQASSPIYLTIDGGREVKREQGEQIDTGRDNVRVRVRSVVAQSVSLVSASNRQDDNRGNINGAVNAIIESGNDNANNPRVTINANSSAVLVAANINRKSLRVSLPSDAAGFVTIGKTGITATTGGLLEPGTTDYIDTTGELRAFNSNAVAVTVYVMEINKI